MVVRCSLPAYGDIAFEDSVRLMGETIKILMETDRVPKDEALSQLVAEMTKTRPLDMPAAKLLCTIDMGASVE